MDEFVFIAIRGGKVIGKPCYSLARLCKNLGLEKLKPSELPVENNGFRIEALEIDKRL